MRLREVVQAYTMSSPVRSCTAPSDARKRYEPTYEVNANACLRAMSPAGKRGVLSSGKFIDVALHLTQVAIWEAGSEKIILLNHSRIEPQRFSIGVLSNIWPVQAQVITRSCGYSLVELSFNALL
jgi:hypothetical protein